LCYRRVGDGPRALVLLHGLASNGTRWSEYARTSRLTEDWCILTPDLRGMGLAVSRDRIDSDVWIADLLAILNREGIARCVIGGHCLGANLAARFALAHPDRVEGLILIEPFIPDIVPSSLGRLARVRWILRPIAALARALNALGVYRRSLPVLNLERLDRKTRHKLAQGAGREILMKRYGSPRHDLRYMPVSSYLQALDETLRSPPDWDGLTMPTLVILSSGNRFGAAADARARLAGIQAASVVEIASDHWIHAERPAELRQAIDSWVSPAS